MIMAGAYCLFIDATWPMPPWSCFGKKGSVECMTNITFRAITKKRTPSSYLKRSQLVFAKKTFSDAPNFPEIHLHKPGFFPAKLGKFSLIYDPMEVYYHVPTTRASYILVLNIQVARLYLASPASDAIH